MSTEFEMFALFQLQQKNIMKQCFTDLADLSKKQAATA